MFPFLTRYSYTVGHLWHDVSSVCRLSRMYCGQTVQDITNRKSDIGFQMT